MDLNKFAVSVFRDVALPTMDLNQFGQDTVLGSNNTFRVSQTPFWVSPNTLLLLSSCG